MSSYMVEWISKKISIPFHLTKHKYSFGLLLNSLTNAHKFLYFPFQRESLVIIFLDNLKNVNFSINFYSNLSQTINDLPCIIFIYFYVVVVAWYKRILFFHAITCSLNLLIHTSIIYCAGNENSPCL